MCPTRSASIPISEIAGLLERRDTWSGRSVLWPITGTDLRVPVDLAALPVYGRDRSFEGFRGFGVARMADTVVDPEALGQRIGESDGDRAVSAGRRRSKPIALAMTTQSRPDDPFQGEVPALSIVQMPDRRQPDKIIKLAEHRPASAGKEPVDAERSAFREIGERLRIEDGDERATTESRAGAPIAEVADAADRTAGDRLAARQSGADAAARRRPGPRQRPTSQPSDGAAGG